MRSALRRLVLRMWPGLREERALWRATADSVARIDATIAGTESRFIALQASLAELAQAEHDDRLDQLRRLVANVEHYQPLYSVAGIIEEPARTSLDRARRLESAMSPLTGQRVLDIGSSLGYMSYYLADRGAQVTGWDLSAANVLVARAVGELNGIKATFATRTLTIDSVKAIDPGSYDSALVLAVLHHLVHFNGLAQTQQIVAELLHRIPVLYLELALKGEDPDLFWDAAQPDDPLDLFALVRDEVEIEHLGQFPTHLSDVERPIYRVARRQLVSVAGRTYPYDRVSFEAYPGAPMAADVARRRYFHAGEYLVKEYQFTPESPWNWQQIIQELFAYSCVAAHPEIHHAIRLIDAELTHDHARLVLSRVEGELLDGSPSLDGPALVRVARDVLKTLGGLRSIGMHHNDVRSWNILVNDAGAWLIDYGLMSPVPVDDDLVALAWALEARLTNGRESYAVGKTELPSAGAFTGTGLEPFVAALGAGERDVAALMATLPGGSEPDAR